MARIKWHLLPKKVENRVVSYHDSGRDEGSHIESKQYHKQLRLKLNDIYMLKSRKHSRFASW